MKKKEEEGGCGAPLTPLSPLSVPFHPPPAPPPISSGPILTSTVRRVQDESTGSPASPWSAPTVEAARPLGSLPRRVAVCFAPQRLAAIADVTEPGHRQCETRANRRQRRGRIPPQGLDCTRPSDGTPRLAHRTGHACDVPGGNQQASARHAHAPSRHHATIGACGPAQARDPTLSFQQHCLRPRNKRLLASSHRDEWPNTTAQWLEGGHNTPKHC